MENSLDEEEMHLRLWDWFPDSSAQVEAGSSGYNKIWRNVMNTSHPIKSGAL